MIVLLIKELSQHYSCYKRRVVLSHSYILSVLELSYHVYLSVVLLFVLFLFYFRKRK